MYRVPMTLIIPDGFAAVIHQIRWTSDPDPMAVTYGVDIDTASPPASADALAQGLGTAFGSNLLARFGPTINLVQTEVEWKDTAGSAPPVVGVSTAGAGPGTNTSTALLPANSAFLVHKRTASGGRRGRGRMYFPGVDETEVDNLGALSSATRTAWSTALAAWLAAIAAVAGVDSMVLLHGPGLTIPPVPTPVTSLTLDPVIATQRRRLRH